MSDKPLHFTLSKIQTDFVSSDKIINVLVGPAGEGKTFCAAIAMVVHAQKCGEPIMAAIVRDTHENIKTSTVISIIRTFASYPQILKWKDDYKQLTIFSRPRVEVRLFGIDDPASLSKLQGPEYALIWLEEPAPMVDKANAGLAEGVYNAALVRAVRQQLQKGHGRLQISMNPADKGHWTYRRLIQEPEVDPRYPLITKAVFNIPYGDNKHVDDLTRQAVKKAYEFDAASYARYVEGRFAPVVKGTRVTPNYNPLRHKSTDVLQPIKGLDSFAMFDSWHNPSCILGQITPSGKLVFLDTLRLQISDIRTLLETQVAPLLNSPRWKDKARAWRIGGDFTMNVPDQSNRQETAAQVVIRFFNNFLGTPHFFEPGPSKWEHIKNALGYIFGKNDSMGDPAILLSADNEILDNALDGGWHYKIDSSGNPTSTLPHKDDASHVGDAFGNAVAILMPTIGLGIGKPVIPNYEKDIITTWDPYSLGLGG